MTLEKNFQKQDDFQKVISQTRIVDSLQMKKKTISS